MFCLPIYEHLYTQLTRGVLGIPWRPKIAKQEVEAKEAYCVRPLPGGAGGGGVGDLDSLWSYILVTWPGYIVKTAKAASLVCFISILSTLADFIPNKAIIFLLI